VHRPSIRVRFTVIQRPVLDTSLARRGQVARLPASARISRNVVSISSGKFMIPAPTRAYDTLYGELLVRIFFSDSFSATSSDLSPRTSKHERPPETSGSRGVCRVTPVI